MNSLLVAAISFIGFYAAYRFYSRFLSEKIFEISDANPTPAHRFSDGRDFVPTNRRILLGHHYTSIAGAAPIVGPAIAIIWGWVPAVLWIVFGAIFIGAVHDFSSLVVSARYDGRSIGDLTGDLIGPTARTLFLVIIFFLLLIVIAVFALIIGIMFTMFPATVFPVWLEIPIAVALGYYVYAKKGNITLWSLIAVALMFVSIYVGAKMPLGLEMLGVPAASVLQVWMVILLIYAYIASTLPVQYLLQPRDYINSHELYIGLGLLLLGLIITTFKTGSDFVAPAVNLNVEGAPLIIPFLFITIACGAISGFHCLVSSGTTVKQLNAETDSRQIAYGGMLLEGVLAIMAIVACGAGFASAAEWNVHYASWTAANGLGAKVGAFIQGSAYFLTNLGLPADLASALPAVIVVSFAATTLDSATRIQRYIISELASSVGAKALTGRHPATLAAIGTALALALSEGTGKGGLLLWPLFGATNQLLAGLALMVVSAYLVKKGKNSMYTSVPMVLMLFVTGWASLINLRGFIQSHNNLLISISVIILLLELWLVVEGVRFLLNSKKSAPATT